jgi:hypothetical protein
MPRPQKTEPVRGNRRKSDEKSVLKADEKVVPETDESLPVQPINESDKAKEPTPRPALDHRRQIVGSDEPRTDQ